MDLMSGKVREIDPQTFNDMGNVIYEDKSQGLTIREGQLFEAETVKGGKNLIVAMRRAVDGGILYAHGDKVRKVPIDQFVRAVLWGDLEPKLAQQIDPGRLSMASIGLDAIANRRTAEETLMFYGEDAEARFMKGE